MSEKTDITNEQAPTITDRMQCDHEPDPATVEYDAKYGRRAVCLKCGARLVITRRIKPGRGSHQLTAKERRRLKRKRYKTS